MRSHEAISGKALDTVKFSEYMINQAKKNPEKSYIIWASTSSKSYRPYEQRVISSQQKCYQCNPIPI